MILGEIINYCYFSPNGRSHNALVLYTKRMEFTYFYTDYLLELSIMTS